MCRSLWTLAAVLGLLSAELAVAKEPPFEAAISVDEAFVRSAPAGDISYPTSRLSRGAKVKVVRRDLGGWLLIEPPEGSHCWIPTADVERRAGNRGVVTKTTSCRIGSDIEPEKLQARQRILKGETVEILDDPAAPLTIAGEAMLKIRPPRGQHRYINELDAVPIDSTPSGPDPFADARELKPEADVFNATREGERKSDGEERFSGTALPSGPEDGVPTPAVESKAPAKSTASTSKSSSSPNVMSEDDGVPTEKLPPGTINAYERLAQIDRQFKEVVALPVAQWQLGPVREQYTALKDAPQLQEAQFQHEVYRRLQAVARYEKNFSDYMALQNVIRETEQRDELLRQQYLVSRQTVATPNTVMTRVTRETNAPPPQWPFAPQTAQRPIAPAPTTQPPTQPPTQPTTQWGRTPTEAAAPAGPQRPGWGTHPSAGFGAMPNPLTPRFDGAGIVQRSALSRPDVPQHVLVAPDGRVLAYLQAMPGINLEQFVGRPMGISGPRSFRQELNADLLVVQRASPVMLKP